MAGKAKTADAAPPACPCGENADIAPKTAGPDGPVVSRCRRCGQMF